MVAYPAIQMPPPDETMPQDGRLSAVCIGDELINMIGTPAVVVPAGFYASGLPFGPEPQASWTTAICRRSPTPGNKRHTCESRRHWSRRGCRHHAGTRRTAPTIDSFTVARMASGSAAARAVSKHTPRFLVARSRIGLVEAHLV
jgi:hypothetical protein